MNRPHVNFDPTFNYGDTDLTKDENLVLWKFAELIKSLITLGSSAERQMEIIGAGAVADEMAEDFYSYFTLSYQQFYNHKLLNEDIILKLKQLDHFLDQRSGDKDPEFWNDLMLNTNQDWKMVRSKANEILCSLNMDNLEIEFDREEKYEITERGKKLIFQSTKTRLSRKNG
jgi:hypothetical protein